MLVVECAEYFARVCAFAERKGMSEDLWRNLWRLHMLGDRVDGEVTGRYCDPTWRTIPPEWSSMCKGAVQTRLYYDSAPASFYFVGSPFNGGLIYHGDQAGWELPDGRVIPPGHAVETFAVTLEERPVGWSLHT